jgi:hypothetical protein
MSHIRSAPNIQKTQEASSNNERCLFMVEDNQITDTNSLLIYQNICGLKNKKADELIGSMSPNLPHILCFSEHHLKQFEL